MAPVGQLKYGETILRLTETIAKDVNSLQRYMMRGLIFLATLQVIEVGLMLYFIFTKGCLSC